MWREGNREKFLLFFRECACFPSCTVSVSFQLGKKLLYDDSLFDFCPHYDDRVLRCYLSGALKNHFKKHIEFHHRAHIVSFKFQIKNEQMIIQSWAYNKVNHSTFNLIAIEWQEGNWFLWSLYCFLYVTSFFRIFILIECLPHIDITK